MTAYTLYMFLSVRLVVQMFYSEAVPNTFKEHYFRVKNLILFGIFYIISFKFLWGFKWELFPYYIAGFIFTALSIHLPLAIYKDYG